MFIHNETIQNIVYIISGLGNILMLACLVAVLLYWNSALIRASSRVFMVLILVFIAIMLCGSVLYAYIPALSESYICHLRPWFTCTSIMGVLAILTAKTNRIRNIFGSSELTIKQVKHKMINNNNYSFFDSINAEK
jgi:hypothetical protein